MLRVAAADAANRGATGASPMTPREATGALRKGGPLLRLPCVHAEAAEQRDTALQQISGVLAQDLSHHEGQRPRAVDGAVSPGVKAAN